MLVLSRREGEAIILETSDGPIRVTLTEYNGNQTWAVSKRRKR